MQKICIPSTGPNLDSLIDSRFGRCSYFLILDKNGKLLEAVENKANQAQRGAGVCAGQNMADEKIEVVIAENIGPRAYMVLNSSGIKIFSGASDVSVKKAFESYKQGKLKEVKSAQDAGPVMGFGRGQGRRSGQRNQ